MSRHDPAGAWLPAGAAYRFLADCAEFYEEIASLKRAHADGALAARLAIGEAGEPVTAPDFARRVSARLLAILERQQLAWRRVATPDEIAAQDEVQYLLAALADEIFVLDFAWPGQAAWLGVLLEHKLYRTRNAGSRVFSRAAELTASDRRGDLGAELAAVYLFVLALGFKGCLRGPAGILALRDVRAALYQLLERGAGAASAGPAFPQAGQHLLPGSGDARLAPLSPWLLLGAYALGADLLLSCVVWLVLLRSF